MCYNSTVSLNTFLFGLGVACLAYYTKIISNYGIIILLSFSAMQLLEYFAWTYYNNRKINRILSIIGMMIIITQVILLNYFLPDKKIRNILLFLIFIFLILFIIIDLKNVNFSMKRGKNKHLICYCLDLPLIWIIITLSFYLIPVYLYGNLLIILFMITILVISLYFYWEYKTWGSMWCYFSNLLWLYVLGKIIINKLK